MIPPERLREELAKEPTREWYDGRCVWYLGEVDRLNAVLAAHRAALRELADLLERRHKKWCFTGQHPCEEPEVHKALAHPLVRQAQAKRLGL